MSIVLFRSAYEIKMLKYIDEFILINAMVKKKKRKEYIEEKNYFEIIQ